MEDISICVPRAVDLHVEVHPAVCSRSMMRHDSTGDDVCMSEHTMMRDLEGYISLKGGDTPRGACRGHSFATTPSYERSPSPYQRLLTSEIIDMSNHINSWLSSSWRSYFWLYWMVGIR
jgi:hypothetical protein